MIINAATPEDVETLKKDIDDALNQLTILRMRVNNFTELPYGSTSADAELMDIRIGADGKLYDTAGEAVRSQFDSLDDELFPLQLSADGKSYNTIGEAHAANNKLIKENKTAIEELAESGGTGGESEQLTEDFVTYSPEWESGKIDSSTGELVESSEYEETTEFIELPVGSTITASGTPVDVYFYHLLDKEYLEQSVDMSDGEVYTATEKKLVRITAGQKATVVIKIPTVKKRVDVLESADYYMSMGLNSFDKIILNFRKVKTKADGVTKITNNDITLVAGNNVTFDKVATTDKGEVINVNSTSVTTLYSNSTGAATGTMTDYAYNYDMLIVVYEAQYNGNWTYGSAIIYNPEETGDRYDSRPATDGDTGNFLNLCSKFNFSNNTFTASCDVDVCNGEQVTYYSGAVSVKRIFGFKS